MPTGSTNAVTGAPPAHFLMALQIERPIEYLIERTSDKRQPLAALPTDEITIQIYDRLLELGGRIVRPRITRKGLENAAKKLAAMAISAADILEQLALHGDPGVKRQIMIAAADKNSWPVNLRLGIRKKRGARHLTLEGADKAKAYLESIRLGQNAPPVLKHLSDHNASPFKRAAELLVQGLLDWREHGAWRPNATRWSKSLLVLDWPMSGRNVRRWWILAKKWMDEQWDTHPEFFRPLIAACKYGGKPLADAAVFNSERRSHIIDLRLKEAFFALVKPVEM